MTIANLTLLLLLVATLFMWARCHAELQQNKAALIRADIEKRDLIEANQDLEDRAQ